MFQKKTVFACFLRKELLSLSRHSEGLGEKDKGLWERYVAAASEGVAQSRQCAAVKMLYKLPKWLGISYVKTQILSCNPDTFVLLKHEVSFGRKI